MKKEWNIPGLEVLDINQTMYGASGPYNDTVSYRGTVVQENENTEYSGKFVIIPE